MSMTTHKILLKISMISALVGLVSCENQRDFNNPADSKNGVALAIIAEEKTEGVDVVQQEGVINITVTDPSKETTLSIEGSSSNASLSVVSFPPGTLKEGQVVTIEESEPLSSVAGSLNIGSSQVASPALEIKSESENDYPENPIEVQLPLNSLGLYLLADNTVPVIFYEVFTPQGKKAGLMDSDFNILGGFVKFKSSFFGSFQLFYIDVIPQKNEVVVEEKILEPGTIEIDLGLELTRSLEVTLKLGSEEAKEMYITDTANCEDGGSWEEFSNSRTWTLAEPNTENYVYVKFRDAGGSESPCVHDTIKHDDVAPTATSVSIDDGASYTNISLVTLYFEATEASEVYITNRRDCSEGGSWQPYTTSRSWTLGQSNATATVFVKFKDAAGNESLCISESIAHDDTAPSETSISLDQGAVYTTSNEVSLILEAVGATEMILSNTSGCSVDGNWEAYARSKTWTLGQTNGTATVYVKFRDGYGNESECLEDSITHDDTAPSGTSISINSGNSSTNSQSVSLDLAATDASEMYISNTAGCSTGGDWEDFNSSKTWTLGQTNSTATVYVKYRDNAGNESSCISDDILHMNSAPTLTSISSFTATEDTSKTITYADLADAANEADADGDTIDFKVVSLISGTLTTDGSTPVNVGETMGPGGEWQWIPESNENGSVQGFSLKAWDGTDESAAAVDVYFAITAVNDAPTLSSINDFSTSEDTSLTIFYSNLQAAANESDLDGDSIQFELVGLVSGSLTTDGSTAINVGDKIASGGEWRWLPAADVHGNDVIGFTVKAWDGAAYSSSPIDVRFDVSGSDPSATSISINSGAAYTTTNGLSLTLAAVDAAYMLISETADCSAGSWEAYSASKSWTLANTNALATLSVKFKDEASNFSSCISDTITHDDIAPTSPALVIGSSGEYTNSSSVTLYPSASNADFMYVTNISDCSSGGGWEAFTTTKAGWALSNSNSLNYVYIKFKDSAGNETACVSDSITQDSNAPAVPTTFDDGAYAYSNTSSPQLSWTASVDSDIDFYEVSIGTSQGMTDVSPWQAAGNGTSFTVTGLSLNPGQTYYANLRAVDLAGNQSALVQGDGFTVIDVVEVSMWENTACSVFNDGKAKCWGSNSNGNLGYGDIDHRGDNSGEMGTNLPYLDLGTGYTIKKIETGNWSSCAILHDDSLKCWGDSDYGQLGLGDVTQRGDNTAELGDHLPTIDLGTGRTVKHVSSGGQRVCAILDNNELKCWGSNLEGRLGLGDTFSRGHGVNQMGDLLPYVDLGTGRTVKQVSAGQEHACAIILPDNTLKCWGRSHLGQLGYGNMATIGDGPSEMGDNLAAVELGTGRTVKQVSAGAFHSCAILDNDKVKCWGENVYGQLGLGDLNHRGDHAGEMGTNLPPVDLGTGRTAKKISSGKAHTCAILDNDKVKCWGRSNYGALGYGDTLNRGDGSGEMGINLPYVNLGIGRTALQITAGMDATCVKLDDSHVKCWGRNVQGSSGLGDANIRGDGSGEMGDSLTPVDILGN